jgi:hypothetical protein
VAVVPGESSGTFNYLLTNGSVIAEAFDRIQIRPTDIDRHMMASARTSMNLEFIEWEDAGFNFWKTTSGTINLGAGLATYTLPTNLVTLEEVWVSQVNGSGSGVDQDRLLVPTTRTGYAALTNKLQKGIVTQYWFQMLTPPQVTFWQVPSIGAPSQVVRWFGLQQMEDANLAGGESPDIPRRAYETFISGMTRRLSEKFAPAQYDAKLKVFTGAWERMTRRDQEPGPITHIPNIGVYGRMG